MPSALRRGGGVHGTEAGGGWDTARRPCGIASSWRIASSWCRQPAGRRRGGLVRALATVLAAAPGGTVAAKMPSDAALWRGGAQELASAGLCVAMWTWALVSMHADRGVALRHAAANTSSLSVRGSGASRTQCPRRDTNLACEFLSSMIPPPCRACSCCGLRVAPLCPGPHAGS